MSKMIELECPQCKSMLELDAGFAGGVCRCSSCGTLMTVPTDPTHERAEMLTRPDRPDAPGSKRPSAASPLPSADARPEAPGRPETPGAPAAPAETPAEAPAATADTEVFTTASGKIIRVPRRLVVTAKTKRKVIRGTIIAVFFGVMAVIVVGTVSAIFFATRSGAPDEAENVETHGEYDRSTNPYKLNSPNFLTIPLRGKAIVVMDSSESSSRWMSAMRAAVVSAASKAPSGGLFQVIIWGEQGYTASPPEPKAMDGAAIAELEKFLDAVVSRGDASPLTALEKAIEFKPDQIILVTGKTLSRNQIRNIGDLIEPEKVKFDAVTMDTELLELEALTKKKGGRYINLPTSQLTEWYKAAE